MLVYHDISLIYISKELPQYKEIVGWMQNRYIIYKAEMGKHYPSLKMEEIGTTFIVSKKVEKEFFEQFKLEKTSGENHLEDGRTSKWRFV